MMIGIRLEWIQVVAAAVVGELSRSVKPRSDVGFSRVPALEFGEEFSVGSGTTSCECRSS